MIGEKSVGKVGGGYKDFDIRDDFFQASRYLGGRGAVDPFHSYVVGSESSSLFHMMDVITTSLG
jgi:hypothetical protein